MFTTYKLSLVFMFWVPLLYWLGDISFIYTFTHVKKESLARILESNNHDWLLLECFFPAIPQMQDNIPILSANLAFLAKATDYIFTLFSAGILIIWASPCLRSALFHFKSGFAFCSHWVDQTLANHARPSLNFSSASPISPSKILQCCLKSDWFPVPITQHTNGNHPPMLSLLVGIWHTLEIWGVMLCSGLVDRSYQQDSVTT